MTKPPERLPDAYQRGRRELLEELAKVEREERGDEMAGPKPRSDEDGTEVLPTPAKPTPSPQQDDDAELPFDDSDEEFEDSNGGQG